MPIAPAQLEFVWLSGVRFQADPNFDRSDAPNWKYVVASETSCDEMFEGETPGDEPSNDGVMWTIVILTAKIEWSRVDELQEDDSQAKPFELELEVAGAFFWRDGTGPDDKMARLWVEYNAQYLLWPYLRQHVSTITMMSNVPTLTIYTMNVPDRPNMDEESSENVLDTGEYSGSSE